MNRANRLILAAMVAAIAIGGALGAFAATTTIEKDATVEVRVWRRISDGELFLSTRPLGGSWTTNDTELDMSEISPSGRFQQSGLERVVVRVEVDVDVPEGVSGEATPRPAPTSVPSETPVAGPCCEIQGMDDNPTARNQVVERMQRVVEFALEEYGLTHSGPITINVSYSITGLRARYLEVFGERIEDLPSTCTFQEAEHFFIGPHCRSNDLAIASEWFTRAVGQGEVTPTWIGHGVRDYFANHYADGAVPVITEDRFRRVIFSERSHDVRRDRASDDMKTLVMLYALLDYGEFGDWLRFYASTAAGLDANTAFESIFETTIDEFLSSFEEYVEHQKIILISTAFSSCREASLSLQAQQGTVGPGAGFPDYRVPLEEDHDGDGIVCEGFVTSDQ